MNSSSSAHATRAALQSVWPHIIFGISELIGDYCGNPILWFFGGSTTEGTVRETNTVIRHPLLYPSSSPSSSSSSSSPTTSLPTARNLSAAVSIGDLCYVIGGLIESGSLNIMECYNTKTNQWSTFAPMLAPRCAFSAGVINGLIYVIGGNYNDEPVTAEVYDPSTNEWKFIPSPPYPPNTTGETCGVTALVHNNYLFAIGGFLTSKCHRYDPSSSGGWEQLPDMSHPPLGDDSGTVGRYQHVNVSIGDFIYTMGGYFTAGDQSKYYKRVEQYNTITKQWSEAKWKIHERVYDVAAHSYNGVVYIAGGDRPSHSSKPITPSTGQEGNDVEWIPLFHDKQSLFDCASCITE